MIITIIGIACTWLSQFFKWGTVVIDWLQRADFLNTKFIELLRWLFSPSGAYFLGGLFLIAFLLATYRTVNARGQSERIANELPGGKQPQLEEKQPYDASQEETAKDLPQSQVVAFSTEVNECPDKWLHKIADAQASDINRYVTLERVVMIDNQLTHPSINFYFYIRNSSIYRITIDDKIDGFIKFEGKRLSYPVSVLSNELKECPPSEVRILNIEQSLRKEEAERISEFGNRANTYFSLNDLNVTIRGGKDFPQVILQRLITIGKNPRRPEVQQSSDELPVTDVDVERAVFTYAGVMFQELQSEHRIIFFIQVFNGLPCKMKIVEQAEGFILLEGKALPTRPQFSVSTGSLNDREISIGLIQDLNEEMVSDISDKLDKGEQLSFSFEALHIYGMIEGKQYLLKLPDGLICKKGITYSTAIHANANM